MKTAVFESFNDVVRELRSRRFRRVVLQAPDGMRNRLVRLSRVVQEAGVEVVAIDGDRCFGACDLPICAVRFLGADAVVHLGHTPYPLRVELGIPVYYIPCYDRVSIPRALVRRLADELASGRPAIFYPIQYYPAFREMLREACREAEVDEEQAGEMASVLIGCDSATVRRLGRHADSVIVIGSGLFHGLGAAVWSGRRTIVLDLYRGEAVDVERERRRVLAIIAERIERFSQAKRVGVIAILKSGQFNLEAALSVKGEAERMGKEAHLITMTDVTPEKLDYLLDFEAFVQTGCPRISIDDLESFSRPVINLEQFQISAGRMRFEDVYP